MKTKWPGHEFSHWPLVGITMSSIAVDAAYIEKVVVVG